MDWDGKEEALAVTVTLPGKHTQPSKLTNSTNPTESTKTKESDSNAKATKHSPRSIIIM